MTTSALPSELDDDARSHSGRHQLHREHSGDLEAHFLHVRHSSPCHPGLDQHCLQFYCWHSALSAPSLTAFERPFKAECLPSPHQTLPCLIRWATPVYLS